MKILRKKKNLNVFVVNEAFSTKQCSKCYKKSMKPLDDINPHLRKIIYSTERTKIDPKITQRRPLKNHLEGILNSSMIYKDYQEKHPNAPKMTETRLHQCTKCKAIINRDFNAAKNIIFKGLSMFDESYVDKDSTRHFEQN